MRVRDVDTERTGTIQYGWLTGERSILWDDEPDTPEFYFEGELEEVELAPYELAGRVIA